MAYQNGSWPGHPQRYGPAQPPTRTYPGYPAYPGQPATQTWPDNSWPGEPPSPGQSPDYYLGPPPAPPQYGLRAAPVGVHIVAVMQYITGLVLILGAGVIGVITFND